MTKLLSKKDIRTMRSEVTNRPVDIEPPLGRSYWGVDRIVTTLEYMKSVSKKKTLVYFGFGYFAGFVCAILIFFPILKEFLR